MIYRFFIQNVDMIHVMNKDEIITGLFIQINSFSLKVVLIYLYLNMLLINLLARLILISEPFLNPLQKIWNI